MLIVPEAGGAEAKAAGDIITQDNFSNFQLELDLKITAGANRGIKTFIDPGLNKGEGSAIGPGFQILDVERHPDAKLGREGSRNSGSFYDMKAAPID